MTNNSYEKIKPNHETGIEMEDNSNLNNNNSNNKNDKENNNNDKDLLRIKVKNAEDPIIYINLKGTDKIQLFKSMILKQKDKQSHYNCRIIFNGKMLKDDQTIADCKLNNDSVVICSITEPLNIQPTLAIIPNSTTSELNNNNNNNNNIAHPFTPPPPPLPPQNIHQDFILDMERARILLNGNGNGIDIDDTTGVTGTQNNRNFLFINENSAARESLELFFGLSFGFFFGPLSLFWISKSYLSRTAKLGIVMGVIFSVSLSLVRMSSTQATS
ncbi:hypothetical protein ACTFIR_008303 [Dictyostelium discoideum]